MSIIEKISKLKLKHHYCDDSFYSCPKHEDGCADKSAGDTCNCGADDHNRIVDEVMNDVASLEIFLAVDYDVTEEQAGEFLASAGYDITEVRRKTRRLVDALLATSPLNPKNQGGGTMTDNVVDARKKIDDLERESILAFRRYSEVTAEANEARNHLASLIANESGFKVGDEVSGTGRYREKFTIESFGYFGGKVVIFAKDVSGFWMVD